MGGATPPRLILELVAGKITIPQGDNSDVGLLSRMERLERQSGFDFPAGEPLIQKAEKLLGWEPQVKRHESLIRTIEYFKPII